MSDVDLSQVEAAVEEAVGTDAVSIAKSFLEQAGEIIATPVVKVILTVLLCLLAIKIVLRIGNRTVERLKVEATTKNFLQSVFRVLVYVIVGLVGAGSLGIEISSLVAVISVCGAALALAAQNALGHFFGGIQLMLTKPFLVGDYISTTAGEGTVAEVGLMNTQLKMADNRIVTIPNGTISEANITNYSRAGTRRLELDFTVSYNAPIDEVKAILMDLMTRHPMSMNEPEPIFARITAFGESSVTYSARVWCKSEDYWDLRFDLLESVKKAFDAAGIEIPYNQLDVHVIQKALER